MGTELSRRELLTAAAAGMALRAGEQPGRAAAGDRVVVAVMGLGGRGTGHATLLAQQPNVEVAYVCDVDRGRAERAAAAVARVAGGRTPKTVTDFRRILEDPAVQGLVVATCNHWHAPAGIMACAAGKHVYVEKPCSHNAREGELLIEAARKYRRHVQMGNQRRSWPRIMEAMELVRSGNELGRVYYAQCWYTNTRPSIGHGKAAPVPEGLDYDLWQGPAPRRAFRDNYLHYNWHWFWHWGNGELGNNGVHTIDVCRWGLGVDYPVQVTSSGGRFRWQDDQETPDTNVVTYTFEGGKSICWEGLSCNQMPERRVPDVVFHGEKGSLAINGGGYTVYDPSGKEVRKVSGPGGDTGHVGNWLQAIREDSRLKSEIEEGHKSTILCHLGNIAYRTGRALKCDSKNGHILEDRKAMELWSREYQKGWEPKV